MFEIWNLNISDTYKFMPILNLSSGLSNGERRVSEHVRIMITVTKVFSSCEKVFSGFTHVENIQLGVCIREHFDIF